MTSKRHVRLIIANCRHLFSKAHTGRAKHDNEKEDLESLSRSTPRVAMVQAANQRNRNDLTHHIHHLVPLHDIRFVVLRAHENKLVGTCPFSHGATMTASDCIASRTCGPGPF